MKILIYGINYWPELTGIGKYTGEMAKWLAWRNHDVRVITTPPYYPAWKISKGYAGWRYQKERIDSVLTFRCPLWVPVRPTAFTRIIHLLSFTVSSLPVLAKQCLLWHPDVVICLAPSFFCAPQAVLLSKITGSKSWLHFQDFEICAMFGSGMASGWQQINRIAHKVQSCITRHFDKVSTISHAMCLSAEQNKVHKNIVFFPNWVDTDFITPEADGSYFRKKWGISPKMTVVLYSGNLGEKQGVEGILDSAYALKKRKNIVFIIVGNGVHKASLVKCCHRKDIKNIQFHSLQPYHLLPSLLCMADIHLIIQKRGTADTVLPSKLTSILSAGGHAIITADLNTELGEIVLGNPGMATLIPPEDNDLLSSAIVSLAENQNVGYQQINKRARKYAESKLGKQVILKDFEQNLFKVVGGED